MHEQASDLALLKEAALAAGEVAMRHFREDPEVWQKDDGQGPVSEADLACDRLLREHLTTARPEYGWLSEESTDDHGRLDAERIFIVDPIDGTRAFLKGEPDWSISLAVADRGRIVTGLVYLPARDQTYSAAAGQGARRDGERLIVSARETLEEATALGAKPQFRSEFWPGGSPPCARSFRSSIAWRLCLVAAARFDLMLTLRDSWEWDVAAGSLIAEEAGARVTDGIGGPLRFNRRTPLNPGVIAAPPLLHDQLMALRTGRSAR